MTTTPDNAVGDDFAKQVSTILANTKTDENGKLQFNDNISEEMQFAVIAEQRRRDTQSAYTRAKQSEAVLAKQNKQLMDKLSGSTTVKLTAEQTEELEELKFSDPEEWRKKLNSIENAEKDRALKEISTEQEITQRNIVLKEFQEANPDCVINDDVIKNDVPPRIVNKLTSNEIDFKEFLYEVKDYLNTGKVIQQSDETLRQPNLSNIPGTDTPSNEAINNKINSSYATEVY